MNPNCLMVHSCKYQSFSGTSVWIWLNVSKVWPWDSGAAGVRLKQTSAGINCLLACILCSVCPLMCQSSFDPCRCVKWGVFLFEQLILPGHSATKPPPPHFQMEAARRKVRVICPSRCSCQVWLVSPLSHGDSGGLLHRRLPWRSHCLLLTFDPPRLSLRAVSGS